MAPVPLHRLVHILPRQKPSNPGDQENEGNASVDGFISALVFNAAIALAFYFVFMIVREKFPFIYRPRTYLIKEQNRPKRLHDGFFSWFSAVRTSDARLLETTGEDAYSVVYYMRWLFYIFTFMAILGAIVLFPVHITGTVNMGGLDRLTLGNIAQSESQRLWANTIVSWIFMVAILYVIRLFLHKAVELRHHHFFSEHAKNNLGGYTLLVRDIPASERSEDTLKQTFEVITPNSVRTVVLSKNSEECERIDKERIKERNKVEQYGTKYLAVTKNPDHQASRPQGHSVNERLHHPFTFPASNLDHDHLNHHIKELSHWQDYRDILADQSQKAKLDGNNPKTKRYMDNFAFVVFNNLFAPHIAAQAQLSSDPNAMTEKFAGFEIDEIIWGSLRLSFIQRQWRKLVALAVTVALVVFWGAGTTFLSSIATLANLVKVLPFLKPVTEWSPAATGIVQGVLPQLAIAIAFSLIPIILRLLLAFSGVPTESEIQRKIINTYYVFLIINVLLVVTIASSVFKTLDTIINNPPEIVRTLGAKIPTISSFFVNYVMLLALSGPASELLQVGQLVLKPLMLRFLTKTPREVLEKSQPPTFEIGRTLANHSFVATVGITYMSIAPLVTIFVAVYFGAWWLAYMYQMQYVYVWKASGGRYLHSAAKHLFYALYIHEVVMLGIFALKTAWGPTALMVLAIVVTAFAHSYAKSYTRMMEHVPADVAVRNWESMQGDWDAAEEEKGGKNGKQGGDFDRNVSSNTVRGQSSDEIVIDMPVERGGADRERDLGRLVPDVTYEDHNSEMEAGPNLKLRDLEWCRRELKHPLLRDERARVWLPTDQRVPPAVEELRKEIMEDGKAELVTEGARMDGEGKVLVGNEMIARFAGKQMVRV
ncbi:hypothetical protein HK097_005714 [Rhizophlyctis rosea]|uniref:DUF221-domain-containing protein n=1 Tax=Rhizophlyctis rosea TaxID=64517 RepID=A0AAD5SEU7_9FUNG|nr:hypothetical protein HK097_005714 [Rhizophlyctis rosea]